MTDIFTNKKRSEIMSRIRSKWTGPERKAHGILKGHKIRHKMHPRIFGHPDIGFADGKTVLFIDGCFWHGHAHCRIPDSDFWRRKIAGNIIRDGSNRRKLKRMGYKVRRIWECRLSSASLLAAAEAV